MKKLPVGIQTFSKIIEGDYLYIDKTEIARSLIESYQYVFLSRPRRFGKSLFLDTLHSIFEGNRELFRGLLIEDQWNWEVTYPVIKISFSGGIDSRETLRKNLFYILNDNQERLDITCVEKEDPNQCFAELIKKAFQKYNQKVVILIDEQWNWEVTYPVIKISFSGGIDSRETLRKNLFYILNDNQKRLDIH